MSQSRILPRMITPGASRQNPSFRSITPIPSPATRASCSGMRSPSSPTSLPPLVTPQKVFSTALASGGIYTGVNYLYHRAMKTGTKAVKTDPSAVKTLSAGRIIKSAGVQGVASLASNYTYNGIAQYIPNFDYIRWANLGQPVLTGVYKTGGSMLMEGMPSVANGIRDYMLSVGSDAAAVYLVSNMMPVPPQNRLRPQ